MPAIAATAPASTQFTQQAIVGLNLDQYCDLAQETTIISQLDIGGAIIFIGQHPTQGRILLANTTGEQHAAVRL